ncbi:TPA: CopG family transcriptional regulator [Escherichia coli]|nr:CopG family transcriptional regulator [Escherichia coli]
MDCVNSQADNFDDDQEATAEGIADIEAGRTISHEVVKAWLLSWGTPNELPPPKVGD